MDTSGTKPEDRSLKELCVECWLEALRISWIIDGKKCRFCKKNKDHLIAKHYEWLENNPDYYRRYNHRRYILKKNGGTRECVGLSSTQHRATANILGLKFAAKYLKGELNGNRRRTEKTATITA